MEIKHNIHLNRIISTIAMLLCICWMPVCAQIRIVDEQDGKPVAGAYIFSSDNHLLCISYSKGNIEPQSGMITISNVAYESKTIDASTIKRGCSAEAKGLCAARSDSKQDRLHKTYRSLSGHLPQQWQDHPIPGGYHGLLHQPGKREDKTQSACLPAIRAKRTQKAHQLQYFHPQRSQIVRHVTHQICEARYHKQHKGGHNIL